MRAVRRAVAFSLIGVAFSTAGCETYLIPAPGPNAAVVKSGQSWNGPAYGLRRQELDALNAAFRCTIDCRLKALLLWPPF